MDLHTSLASVKAVSVCCSYYDLVLKVITSCVTGFLSHFASSTPSLSSQTLGMIRLRECKRRPSHVMVKSRQSY